MAYQNVGTPRFYIDSGLYQQSIGAWTPEDDQVSLLQLNPTNIMEAPTNDIAIPRISPIRYVAFLGHNGGSYYPAWGTNIEDDIETAENESQADVDGFAEVVNMNGYNDEPEAHSGFSIGTFNDSEDATVMKAVIANEEATLGAVSIGNYYDMPHSPDLNLKLSYEYDGVETIQTKGGATLSNASYTKPADWGDRGAWQLGDVEGVPISNLRSGRRVWDLSFSYLSDSDIFPSVAAVTNYEAGDSFVQDNPQDNTLLEGTDFFSAVWNKTLAGHLPFIFQPDGGGGVAGEGNFNPDQFCIARFVGNSLQYDQVANNVYNIKLKIRESW